MAKKATHSLGMSAMIASMVLAGSITVLNKSILEDVTATQLSALRFSVAVILMVSLMRFKPSRIKPKEFWLILLKSILNVAEFIFFYIGLQRLDASLTSILTAGTPLLIYLGAVRYLHEKARKRVLGGLILAIIGATIISLTDKGTIGAIIDVPGLLYVSASILINAITTLMSKSLVDHINPKAVMKANTVFMALGFWIALAFAGQWPSGISAVNWLYIVISGAGLFLVYVLYYQSLKVVKAEDTGVVSYLQHLAAITGAIIFLGERPEMAFWVGTALIILGILVAEINTHIKIHRKIHLHYLRHHK